VAVGIGSPGPLNLQKGMIISLPNVPGMENVPLRDAVGERINLPTTLENDANAAAYGEFIAGAGKDTDEMVMLTLGTGLGSGVVHRGEILHGAHGIGGEAGHLIVHPGGRRCGCGQRGCAEQYCSASFLAKYTAERVRAAEQPTSLTDVLDANGELTAKDIAEAAANGDALAGEAWDECCYHLAIACVSICRLIDPGCIVLAGGLTNAGDRLLKPVRRHASEQNWTLCEAKTEIRIAALGADAGAIGAAGVAWHQLDNTHP
jgi:glucokinase